MSISKALVIDMQGWKLTGYFMSYYFRNLHVCNNTVLSPRSSRSGLLLSVWEDKEDKEDGDGR